jgi:hypothetical protein
VKSANRILIEIALNFQRIGYLDILTAFIPPFHEHGYHLIYLCLISFIDILEFSMIRSFISSFSLW